MALHTTLQSLSSPVLPGTWKLGAGRAITLHPREDAVLKIAHGRVWVTFDAPHRGHGNELGDHFLSAGEQVTVQAGQRAVIEPFGRSAQETAYFSWDALPAAVRSPVRAVSRWQVAVVQPMVDLRLALVMAGSAVVRLGFGLVGVIADLLPARADSGFARAFNPQPGTCPNGAMN